MNLAQNVPAKAHAKAKQKDSSQKAEREGGRSPEQPTENSYLKLQSTHPIRPVATYF